MDECVKRAIIEVVADLRANERVKHTTKYENLLAVMLTRPNDVTTIDQLTRLFVGSANPEQSVRNLIGRLNEKLAPYRVSIQHVTAYKLTADE
jgi:DNA-binding response OmpR family regulator